MAVSEKVRRLAEGYADLSDQERQEFVFLVAPDEEPDLSPEWKEELHKRSREIDENRTVLTEGNDFLKRLRAV